MSAHELPHLAKDFENIDLFVNPESTNSQRTLKLVKSGFDSWDSGPRIEYHETIPNIDDFKQKLVEVCEAKDGQTITGIIAGDGSINNLVKIKQDIDLPKVAQKSPLWTPGGGNAVNFFKAVTSKFHSQHPEEVIKHGVIDEFYPLLIKTTSWEGEKDEKLAASVFSVGAMAVAASFLNDQKFRTNKLRNYRYGELITDPIRILKSLKSTSEFEFLNQDNQATQAYDLLFLNSPHIAKIIYAKNVKLTGPAYTLEIQKKKTIDVVKAISMLAIGRSKGRFMDDFYRFTVLSDNVMAQVDGEAWEIASGTNIEVSYANNAIPVVTTIENP